MHYLTGQIVGAIFFNNDVTKDALLNIVMDSRPSARFLEEEKSPPGAADVERLLVRRTLAWLTGIILLISTLLGVRSYICISSFYSITNFRFILLLLLRLLGSVACTIK